jgi:crooked neck
MTWKPNYQAWKAYANFEEKMGEYENARNVMYEYLNSVHNLESFLKVAKYEDKHKNYLSERKIFEEGLTELGKEALCQEYFLAFIKFELDHKEYDRCRALFKFGLENIESNKEKLNENYIKFEKKYGNAQKLEDMIINRRRILYEKKLKENSMDYDTWFDYTKLEEDYGTESSCREIYERAIGNIPPIKEKKYWKRYVYLWINYALYEECVCNNIKVTEEIYKNILDLIPHKEFTFSKIWILATNFYLRQKNIDKVRKLFGISMGICPRKKIIDSYINLELQLGNNDRVKKIFQNYIQKFPNDENIWFNFCKFEESLEEYNVAEVLYINSIKFLKENKNDKGLYKMYTELINFYSNLLLNSKEKKEKNSLNNKIKKAYEELLKNKYVIKNLDKEKEIDIWNQYAEIYFKSNKFDEMDKIYKKCLEEILNQINDEEEKVKYSEIIINNWTSHYEGNKERLDKIKEILSYNDENEELEENESDKISENNEYNDDNNKNKVSSLMEKALEWKEKNKDN